MSLPYTITVGLEVHVELSTETKMFCRCVNDPFRAEPNQHTCPVCLGLPGALPVPNKEAVRRTILLGTALGSTFSQPAMFDRKHYFYPDNPKGYQISQLDHPFCVGGSLDLLDEKGEVQTTVRFNRAHLEEDAGKLQHGAGGLSLVNLNRAGVPLVEAVTEPDLHSAADARRFMQEMQLLVRTLGISNADLEKGEMRADVNISIQFEFEGHEVSSPITEVKNVNSTRAVERAIETEAQRLYDEWMAGGPVRTRKGKITVGWDEDTQSVNIQRAKEAAADYRYLPEPDLPPIDPYADAELNPDTLRATLPVLPNARRKEFLELGVQAQDIETLLTGDSVRLAYYDVVSTEYPDVAKKTLINWIINASEIVLLPAKDTVEMIDLAAKGSLSFSAVKPHLASIAEKVHSESLKNVLKALNLLIEEDPAVIESVVSTVLTEHASVVAEYKAGNQRVFGFLVGQAMKKAAGKAQPQSVSDALKRSLESK